MDGFDQFGGGLLLAAVVVLWLIYLVPAWMQRRSYMATERQVTRMQQALRVMTETSGEGSHLVETELSARKVAIVAREARIQRRLSLRAERERAKAATREFAKVERLRSEQEKEVARLSANVESARVRAEARAHRENIRKTAEFRSAALRRGRLVSTSISALGIVGIVVGLIVLPQALAGWWVLAIGAALTALGVTALRAAARTAAAYRARGLVSVTARSSAPVSIMDVAGDAASASPSGAAPGSATGATGAEKSDRSGADADRSWTPQPLPRPVALTREQILAAARAEAELVASAAVAGSVVEAAVSGVPSEGAGVAAEADSREADSREELRRASEEAVAALRAAAQDDPTVAPIEAGRAGSDDFSWLTGLEAETASAAAENTSRLDEVLQRRRNVG